MCLSSVEAGKLVRAERVDSVEVPRKWRCNVRSLPPRNHAIVNRIQYLIRAHCELLDTAQYVLAGSDFCSPHCIHPYSDSTPDVSTNDDELGGLDLNDGPCVGPL